jgi:glycerol uptake facilitator-like aquaporin
VRKRAGQLPLAQRAAAEFTGTALLLAAVVGSGIMAERLSAGNVALALLANSIATGATLAVLIASFQAASGAHFNPIVSIEAAARRQLAWTDTWVYGAMQAAGALTGVLVANLMFDGAGFSVSEHHRSGAGQFLGEAVATFGLIVVIRRCAVDRPAAVAPAVGAYILGAYWFTSSTSFANPVVTLARAFTNTFTGISLGDVPAFCFFQIAGAVVAVAFMRLFDAAPTGTMGADPREERVG